jgi:hypothetical protein
MKVEYITDDKGNQKSVLIDINEWKKFNQKYKQLQNKLKVLTSLEKAVEEVKELKSGKKTKTSMKDLLNEI